MRDSGGSSQQVSGRTQSDSVSAFFRKYVERRGDGCFADTRPSKSKWRLPEAARGLHQLVEQFKLSPAATLESLRPRAENCDGIVSHGSFETSTVFLDKVAQPMGITVWRNGVLISAAPDLLYAVDTNGDGCADIVRKVLTGLSTQYDQARLNILSIGSVERSEKTAEGAPRNAGWQWEQLRSHAGYGQIWT